MSWCVGPRGAESSSKSLPPEGPHKCSERHKNVPLLSLDIRGSPTPTHESKQCGVAGEPEARLGVTRY